MKIGLLVGALVASAMVLGCGGFRPEGQAPAPPERPNFIIVVSDDQRWDALGYAGNAIIQTPNLDALAKNWNIELAARSALVRQGWSSTSLKIGDTVTIEGIQARSGVNMANARSVMLPDGRKVFSGENQ